MQAGESIEAGERQAAVATARPRLGPLGDFLAGRNVVVIALKVLWRGDEAGEAAATRRSYLPRPSRTRDSTTGSPPERAWEPAGRQPRAGGSALAGWRRVHCRWTVLPRATLPPHAMRRGCPIYLTIY
eukprot:jgi/Tetstr1/443626/TSEL_031625.t1